MQEGSSRGSWEEAPAPTAAARRRHITQAERAGDCRGETEEQQPGAAPPRGLKPSSSVRSSLCNSSCK